MSQLQERIAQFRKMANDDPDNELGHFRHFLLRGVHRHVRVEDQPKLLFVHLAVAEEPTATFQLAWTACSLTRLPSRRSVL